MSTIIPTRTSVYILLNLNDLTDAVCPSSDRRFFMPYLYQTDNIFCLEISFKKQSACADCWCPGKIEITPV